MKHSIKLFVLAVISMVAGTLSYAQVTTASIAGRISDNEGPVAGAAVMAVYQPTGATYYAVTDVNGAYRINGITPGGPYTVSVDMLGYRKVVLSLSDELFQLVVSALPDNLGIRGKGSFHAICHAVLLHKHGRIVFHIALSHDDLHAIVNLHDIGEEDELVVFQGRQARGRVSVLKRVVKLFLDVAFLTYIRHERLKVGSEVHVGLLADDLERFL